MSNGDNSLPKQPSKTAAPTVKSLETPEQSEAPPPMPQTSQHTPRQSP